MAMVSLQNLLDKTLNHTGYWLDSGTPAKAVPDLKLFKTRYRKQIKSACGRVRTIGDFIMELPDMCGPEWGWRNGMVCSYGMVCNSKRVYKIVNFFLLDVDDYMKTLPEETRLFAAMYSCWEWRHNRPAPDLTGLTDRLCRDFFSDNQGRTFNQQSLEKIKKRWTKV